jgi:hypothetical protein
MTCRVTQPAEALMCDTGNGHQALTVAAMLHHLLPGAPYLRLEITADDNGIWLHLTYPPFGAGLRLNQ